MGMGILQKVIIIVQTAVVISLAVWYYARMLYVQMAQNAKHVPP
jgi:hypothetical protein